ncbi:Bug family tripartite tricarboxylate transporter substrate binding protein [Hydrogenophaga palleronii]|uniref:Bug family tripartite tricarboxylate transporter substrate binding protein n=1 Tax=Hydrogenophaga palleronii TaxID=65655 RepID=UPI000A028720|nr:tripartite tricarboxylate transporter substrate-binding protein [Hydrogenophaga palleronii]
MTTLQCLPRRAALACAVALGCAWAAPALAQDNYPSRPIRMMLGYPAGSGIDAAARQMARQIEVLAGQPVVVDNRPGALGNLAASAVAAAAGDPYTILFTPNSTHAANTHLFKKLPFDPVADFTPVSSVATVAFVMVTNPKLTPEKSVGELLVSIRKDPTRYHFGSGNATGLVAGSMFKTMANVDILSVPYKGVPPAMNDLMGGRIHMVFADATLAIPQAKGGNVRALAVTGGERVAALPDVPTMAEAGLPGYDLSGWFAVFMPARVPAAAAEKLNGFIQTASRNPQYVEFMRGIGAEPQTSTPAQLLQRVKTDTQAWGKLVEMAGITPE